MASIGEAKALMQQASMQAGEAWQALQTAKEQVGAALAVVEQAVESAQVSFDGTGHDTAISAVSQLNRAEAEVRAIYVKIDEEAQDALLAAQNACEAFMGIIG